MTLLKWVWALYIDQACDQKRVKGNILYCTKRTQYETTISQWRLLNIYLIWKFFTNYYFFSDSTKQLTLLSILSCVWRGEKQVEITQRRLLNCIEKTNLMLNSFVRNFWKAMDFYCLIIGVIFLRNDLQSFEELSKNLIYHNR